jgi:hypothetical protein
MEPTVPAPKRIYSQANSNGVRRLLFAEGDQVPYRVAVELGLVASPAPAPLAKPAKRSRKAPAEHRAARPVVDVVPEDVTE